MKTLMETLKEILVLFCLCSVGTMIPIGFTFSWLLKKLSNRNEVRLDSRPQRAVSQFIEPIRSQSDLPRALDQSMAPLQKKATLPLTRSTPLPSQEAIPSLKPPVPLPETTPTSQPLADNSLALDNITLLLYLGVGLVVIAVAVFVSSSWDDISGVVQWRIVAAFAFAFLGMGEIFVRRSTVLAPAGETFRGVGMVLMPFVALAYQRFVLDGNASAFFWFMTTLLLVAFYYAFYYISAAKRLAAYLSVLSLGTLALLLPNVLELGNIWQAHALLLMSAILFITIWQVEPDGRALPKRLWSGKLFPLAESHFIAGLLYALASWLPFLAFTIESPSATTLYLTLHTLLYVFLSTWFASDLLAGSASLLTYSLGTVIK
jgi:hypothetical protein